MDADVSKAKQTTDVAEVSALWRHKSYHFVTMEQEFKFWNKGQVLIVQILEQAGASYLMKQRR